MSALLGTVALAVVLFTATNIDDVLLLVALLADRRYGFVAVCTGQFVGLALLAAASLALSSLAVAFAPEYLRWFGLAPILIGAFQLYARWRGEEDDDDAPPPGVGSAMFTVTALTIANGADNVAIYVPAFANSTARELAVILIVFAIMTALWCAAAAWLVKHPAIGPPLQRHAHRALPWIFIALGVWILFA